MAVLVHVHDLRSTRVGEYRLESLLTVGKDQDCEIVLSSPYISPRHAELKLDGEQVSVHALGFNGVFVNDLDVPAGSDRLVNSGDVVSVPGYVFHFTGLVASQRLNELEFELEFSALKSELHKALLADAGLRDLVSDTNDDETAEALRNKLSELLDRPDVISENLVEYIVKKEVREQVVDAVVRGGVDESGRAALAWSLSTDQVALDQFVATCLHELGVDGDLGRTQINDVRDGFGPVFERNKSVLGRNQMYFIARESIRADIESLVFGLGTARRPSRTS